MPTASVDSPIGRLGIVENDGYIVRLLWTYPTSEPKTALLKDARNQICAYFNGDLKDFELPLAPAGNPFQRRVYSEMSMIPFGETRTYGEIAKKLKTAAQPIGGACGSNPIPIIIPCHRVVAIKGIGGYSGAGGIDTKLTLLKHEQALPYLIV